MKIDEMIDIILKKFKIKLNKKQLKLFTQIFKFVLVGGTAFVIDYLFLILFKEVFKFSTLLSAAMSFTISVIYNYIASVKWVFDVNNNKSKMTNFIVFIILSVIGLILTEIIMYIGEDILKISYLIDKIIATLIVMVFNFITRKIFLERKN